MTKHETCPNCQETNGLSCDYASTDFDKGVSEKLLDPLVTLVYTCSECGTMVTSVTKRENVKRL